MYMHIYQCILTEQSSDRPLHYAAKGGHTACVEHLLSSSGIDVNITNGVSLLPMHICTYIYMYMCLLIIKWHGIL